MKRLVFYVRFINGNNSLSKKTYRYLAKDASLEKILSDLCITVHNTVIRPQKKFKMVNDHGYSYKGSEAVVWGMETENLSYNELNDLRTIVEVTLNKESYPIFNDEIKVETVEKEEKGNMKKMFDFDFGAATDVKLSIYGPAFKDGEGNWFAFNGQEEYVDVTEFLISDINNMCFKVPIAKKAVSLGDFIRHNGGWVRIVDVDDAGRLIAEKIFAKEVVTILPTKNAFGFDFYTKLMTPMTDMFGGKMDEANPFGNFLPFMLMTQNKDGDKSNMLGMMMAMGMMNSTDDKSAMNPLMLAMLMSK